MGVGSHFERAKKDGAGDPIILGEGAEDRKDQDLIDTVGMFGTTTARESDRLLLGLWE